MQFSRRIEARYVVKYHVAHIGKLRRTNNYIFDGVGIRLAANSAVGILPAHARYISFELVKFIVAAPKFRAKFLFAVSKQGFNFFFARKNCFNIFGGRAVVKQKNSALCGVGLYRFPITKKSFKRHRFKIRRVGIFHVV